MSFPHYHNNNNINDSSAHTSLYPSFYTDDRKPRRESNPHEMGFNNDHLEEFDSQIGDVEAGSLGATQATGYDTKDSRFDDSIKRGILNAQAAMDRNESARTPNGFLNHIMHSNNGEGYSVTTGQFDQTFDGDAPDTYNTPADTYTSADNYTFDGSTIASANDITHKKFAPQQQVVHFPQHSGAPYAQNGGVSYPELKLNKTQSTENTSYSSSKRSGRSDRSVKKVCCGLGKLGVILVSVAVILVSLAFILWLVLDLIPSSQGNSAAGASACCQGDFEPGWAGKEICSSTDVCCVVCADSIVSNQLQTGEDANSKPPRPPPNNGQPEDDTPQPSTTAPTTPTPTQTPSVAPSLAPTLAPTTAVPSQAPTVMESNSPTSKCCTDSHFGDFIGRPRCANNNDCCVVCPP